MSEPTQVLDNDILPMFQQEADEVDFSFQHSVSKYASIIIDSCAAHLDKFNLGMCNFVYRFLETF